MAELTFINPSYLWILLIVPILIIVHFLTLKQNRAAVIKFSNFEAIERVAKGDFLGHSYKGILKNRNLGLLMLRAIVYCLLILSVAGTTLVYIGNSSEFDYVFAIDASSSMLANDFSPNRFDAAREAASTFTEIVPSGAKIGIVTFSSTSIVELRPTSNLEDIKSSMNNLQLHQAGGTAIGDAIITSTNLFGNDKSKMIVLLTDGQSNVGMRPELAIEYAKKNDVVIQSIGVATTEGGNISQLNLLSRLDEGLLKKMADETNGKFFLASDIDGLKYAFSQIAIAQSKPITLNLSWMLLVLAIILLGFEWIFINTLYKTIP